MFNYKDFIETKEQLHKTSATYTKEINGKIYTYTYVTDNLYKRTSPDGKSVFVSKVPVDVW